MRWQPPIHIPNGLATHFLVASIPANVLHQIKVPCQLPPSTPIIQSTRHRNVILLSENIRDLVSYGNETTDEVMTLYLEIVCGNRQATYLTPSFYSKLLEHEWTYVSIGSCPEVHTGGRS